MRLPELVDSVAYGQDELDCSLLGHTTVCCGHWGILAREEDKSEALSQLQAWWNAGRLLHDHQRLAGCIRVPSRQGSLLRFSHGGSGLKVRNPAR